MRAYDKTTAKPFLAPLPDNPVETSTETAAVEDGSWVCSPESLNSENGYTTRHYEVLALDASSFVEGTELPYRSPVELMIKPSSGGAAQSLSTAIESPEGLVYVLAEDVERVQGKWALRKGIRFEPLVLRAAAGDCIKVELRNHFDPLAPAFATANPTDEARSDPDPGPSVCTDAGYLDNIEENANMPDPHYAKICAGSSKASIHAGLSPQLVAHDASSSAGINVGDNAIQTVLPGESRTYHWYAGHVTNDEDGQRNWMPVEFGAANLLPADPLFQHSKGLFGALIIEPEGGYWRLLSRKNLQAL